MGFCYADKNAAFCLILSSTTEFLKLTLRRSKEMQSVGAYLNWYSRQDCNSLEFDGAMDGLTKIIQNYVAATSEAAEE